MLTHGHWNWKITMTVKYTRTIETEQPPRCWCEVQLCANKNRDHQSMIKVVSMGSRPSKVKRRSNLVAPASSKRPARPPPPKYAAIQTVPPSDEPLVYNHNYTGPEVSDRLGNPVLLPHQVVYTLGLGGSPPKPPRCHVPPTPPQLRPEHCTRWEPITWYLTRYHAHGRY